METSANVGRINSERVRVDKSDWEDERLAARAAASVCQAPNVELVSNRTSHALQIQPTGSWERSATHHLLCKEEILAVD